jgi:hypothetical protein
MGPKYKSGGEDDHNGEWEYAGDPDTKTWHDWRDHGNDKGGGSQFEYRDSTEHNIAKEGKWPAYHEQELPHKE